MECVKLLASKGANLMATDDTGANPLMIAAKQGNAAEVWYLISKGIKRAFLGQIRP